MASGLDVAFFGSSLVSAYWNGAATYYRGIIRALAERLPRQRFMLRGTVWRDKNLH
jgi:spore maturation protein CgeB